MSKKIIIITILAVIIIAGGVTAALFFAKHNVAPAKQTPVASSSKVTVPDLSKNYGACDLLTTTTIKAALGTSANSLATGFDTGLGNLSGGDIAQNCVYGLTQKVTQISTSMLTDSFYTTVYIYKDQANKDADSAAYDGATMVAGIGDKAGFFTSVSDTLKTTEYSLRVDEGLRYYTFAVRQDTSTKSFDASSAQTALTTVAKSVNYAQIEGKS